MKTYQLTEETFLKDVANHEMIIIRNDGINRHIRFKKPNTSCMHFDLITWPGVLCYTGDMGTYVFSRLADMFEFFRTDREYKKKYHDSKLAINLSYWAEKLISNDRDGVKEWSSERFIKNIKEYLDNNDASKELRQAVAEEVLINSDEHEYEAMRSAIDFVHEGECPLQDFYEYDCKEYTHRFVWCCYALAYGIEKYDEKFPPDVLQPKKATVELADLSKLSELVCDLDTRQSPPSIENIEECHHIIMKMMGEHVNDYYAADDSEVEKVAA